MTFIDPDFIPWVSNPTASLKIPRRETNMDYAISHERFLYEVAKRYYEEQEAQFLRTKTEEELKS